MCTLVSIGTTADEERSGRNFIVGRFLGILFIGIVIAAIGAFVQIPALYFIVIFGVLTVLFGVLLLLRAFNVRVRFLTPSEGEEEGGHETKHANHNGQGQCRKSKRGFKGKHVFLLGLFRGATPCLKIMVLAPLLIAVDLWLAVLMVIVYALASTIYPVMGFLFGSFLRKFERYHRHLRVAGALILIVIGVYSVMNGFLVGDHSGGGL